METKDNIHERFPQFKRYDTLSFIRLFIGLMTLVWPRFILFSITLIIMAIGVTYPKEESTKAFFMKYGCRIAMFSFGSIIPSFTRSNKSKDVYKKYLGQDYLIDYDRHFATYIINHCTWIDPFAHSYIYQGSFIAKKSMTKIPLIKALSNYNQTFYLDRINKEERNKIAQEIIDRQKHIMENPSHRRMIIYPEGTVSSGKHILQFKRGAFVSLCPIKPYIEMIDHDPNVSISTGILSIPLHIIVCSCYLYHHIQYIELPVIVPTEYMFKTYALFGKDNWEIYMEVCRRIMSEISGLQLSETNFPEKLIYSSLVKGKVIKNT